MSGRNPRVSTIRFVDSWAPLAQALKWTEPEFVDVAVVRFDVITDFCRRDDAALQAELAERMICSRHLPPLSKFVF
jgi:predicted metal-dependent HD superfamily phosphohydrolase